MSTVAQEDERLDVLVHGQPLAREKRQVSPLERACKSHQHKISLSHGLMLRGQILLRTGMITRQTLQKIVG